MRDAIRHNDILIPLRPGWEDATQVVVLTEAADGFRPNLVVSQEQVDDPGETVEAFAARQLASLGEALDDYALIRDQLAGIGQLSGLLREHSFRSGDVRVQQLQLYRLERGTAHTFTYTYTYTDDARQFAERRRRGLEMLGSIELVPE